MQIKITPIRLQDKLTIINAPHICTHTSKIEMVLYLNTVYLNYLN